MTNFSGNLSSQKQVNVASGGPQGEGMDSRRNQVIPDGYKQTEVGVIPEDWHVNTLEKITKNKRPISYGIVQTGPEIYDGVPCLRVLDIVNGTINTGNLIHTTAQISNSYKRTQLKVNDLVIPLRGKVGEVGLIETKLVGANLTRGVALIALEEEHSPQFIKQALCSEGSKNRLLNSMNGSALQEISIGTLRSFKLAMPKLLEEQTAIANALSDMDALLGELEKLIAKKQAIKTATMQQLLTGKTRLPQFAFYSDINSPEGAVEGKRKGTKPSELGEIPEDWEVYPMHKVIASNQLGGNYTNSESETEFPLIKMGNLDRGKIKLNKLEYVIGKVSQRDRLKSGDILFNTRNTLDLVGKVAIWRNEMPEAYFNSNILRLKFDKTIVASNEYINAAMNTKTFITDLANVATGTTSVAAIYTRDLFQLNLLLPPKEEQTAIASILSDMDNEIQTLEQRLSKTRQIKQGMMQELLTGKTRLPFDKDTTSEVSV